MKQLVVLASAVFLLTLLPWPGTRAAAATHLELPVHLGTEWGAVASPLIELSPTLWWSDRFGASLCYSPLRVRQLQDSNDTTGPHNLGELRADASYRFFAGRAWSTDLVAGLGVLSPVLVGGSGGGGLFEQVVGLRATRFFGHFFLGGRAVATHSSGTVETEGLDGRWQTEVDEVSALLTLATGVRF